MSILKLTQRRWPLIYVRSDQLKHEVEAEASIVYNIIYHTKAH